MEIAIWVVVTLLLWFALDIPLIWCLGIVALAWIMIKGGGAGNAFTGITRAIGGILNFAKRLLIFVPVFLGITMIVVTATGLSPHSATRKLQVLGPMPWNWSPDNIDLPLMLFVCLMFLVTMASAKVAWGDYKLGFKIFAGAGAVLVIVLYLPRTGEAIRPKPTAIATPTAGETQGWADTDQSAAERGIAPVVIDTAKKAVVGDNVAKRTGVLLRETTGGFLEGLFPPKPKPVESTKHYIPAVVRTTPGPCEGPWSFRTLSIPPEGLRVYLCQGWKSWSDGAVTITTPSGRVIHDKPGVLVNIGFEPNGVFTFRSDPEGSERTEQIYNRW